MYMFLCLVGMLLRSLIICCQGRGTVRITICCYLVILNQIVVGIFQIFTPIMSMVAVTTSRLLWHVYIMLLDCITTNIRVLCSRLTLVKEQCKGNTMVDLHISNNVRQVFKDANQ